MHDKWLTRFKEEVLPLIVNEIHPSRVLFFGSRATGSAVEESDIDVIIISDAFKDIPFMRRMGKILKLAKFPKHIDCLCYTPEEFRKIKLSSSIIENVLENFVEAPL